MLEELNNIELTTIYDGEEQQSVPFKQPEPADV